MSNVCRICRCLSDLSNASPNSGVVARRVHRPGGLDDSSRGVSHTRLCGTQCLCRPSSASWSPAQLVASTFGIAPLPARSQTNSRAALTRATVVVRLPSGARALPTRQHPGASRARKRHSIYSPPNAADVGRHLGRWVRRRTCIWPRVRGRGCL